MSQPIAPSTSSAADAVEAGRAGPMTTIPFDQPVALTASGAPFLNPRSCVTCRRRKVRCDKTMPCHNCRRAQISCVYPAPGRAPRRPRPRDPNAAPKGASEREAHLLKRLHKLEGIVEELSGQIDVDSGSGGGPRTASAGPSVGASPEAHMGEGTTLSSAREQAVAEHAGTSTEQGNVAHLQKNLGRLVLHDKEHTRRYVSNAFWSKLNDELDELRNDMHSLSEDTDEGDETSPEHSPPKADDRDVDHHAFLLGYRSADVDLTPLHPLPSQVPFLWQVYQENVDPLIKVFHRPTIEALMRELRRSPGAGVRAADEAVLFTIYYSAITSMEEDEVETNFGTAKGRLLAQYRFGVEQALAKADLLNTTDMAVLQALAVFLMIVRRHDDTKFCWTMTALAVRIAQALGLHRDGVQLGLAPLEVESRRRLWWAIMALDLRSAEELGSDLTVGDRSFDTRLPTNLDDADLDEGSVHMPPAREGRTDTAVSLVRYEICALARRLHTITSDMGAVGSRSDEDVAASLEERERMLVEVHARVEQKFLRHVFSGDDPLFWVASMVARVIMAKIGLLIYQPVLFPGTGPALSEAIRDRLFVSTVEIVEYNHILNTDPRCKQWRWLFQTYRQWHAIAYMLLEVARRPWSATSERAWEAAAILGYDSHPLEGASQTNHTAVWMPMKKLYAKARRHRQAEAARLRADPAAAQELEALERENPFLERLDPVAGMEMRMSQLRARWRRLVGLPQDRSPSGQLSPEQQRSSGQPPGLVATLMAPDFNSADVWQYVYEGDPMEPSGLFPPPPGALSVASSMGPSPAVSGEADMSRGEAALRQQAVHLRQADGGFGDNPNAWLWSDPFTSVNTGTHFDDMQGDDLDMSIDFGDGFDWQAWQQQLRGLP